jgi:UPF0755 protein
MLAGRMDEGSTPPGGSIGTRRPRRGAALLAAVAALGALAAVGGAAAYYQRCREAPPPDGRTVRLEVPRGATGEDVLAALHRDGLVRCGGLVGDLLLRGTGRAGAIRAGTYELEVGMSLGAILDVLTSPPPKAPTVRVTFPEGLRIDSPVAGQEDIVSIVERELGLSGQRFRRLVEGGGLALPDYVPPGRPLEGFLFPATYEFVRAELDERAVARAMLEAFEREADELGLRERARRLGFRPYEIVVIASMIEEEYRVPEEGPLISGVIHNRLELGMTLGIDATLLYADPTPDGELSTADIETDTPYNTRRNAGLPPTPIASPGAATLRWALHPARTPFLYYVLCPPDGEGVHRFARTLAEHERNVRECLG